MLVTVTVFNFLTSVGMLAIAFFVAGDLFQAALYKGFSFLDRLLRKIPSEQYLQLVVLPLCGAIGGGLISTAFPIFLDHPWWRPDDRTYIGFTLVAIGLAVVVAGPLMVHVLTADPKNLVIVMRIERLKDGDWTRDSKDEVIKTIDEERVAIIKQQNKKNTLFLAFLILLIASGAGWLPFVYVVLGIRSGVFWTLVISAIVLCGIFARYWMRPKSLRSALKDLDSYQEEADKLSPPAFTTPPSRASAVPRHYNQQDLRMAVGGLLVGAILARLGAVRSRGERRG